jgi:uncharacterized protein (TIGR03790 family)
MSAAWEGYKQHARKRRRRPDRRRRWWLAGGGALVVAAVTLLALQQCLPQGQPVRRNPSALLAREVNPATAALVIYNENDPLSRDLADFYAARRGIESDRIVGLKCSINEEISRQEYDQTIADPLRAIFDARGWWTRSPEHAGIDPSSTVSSNRIRYLVLMRGIPLKIQETSGYPGDASLQPAPIGARNAASVDSELAVLGMFTHHISGVLVNPYYRSYQRFTAVDHPEIMLAARLDAPTGSMVRRMIEDSLAVEKIGLWGRCYVDGRGLPAGNGLAEGDAWLNKIATQITPFALPTIYDNAPALFAADYPMTEAAMYFGWYSEQPAGALADPHFQFEPGAVACHIHSFSATSVRDPAKWWVAPLLSKGAAAVLGNVYEPYLSLTTHLDIFADRLCSGMTFVESAYAATPALSWMDTFVGDPLYRPCAAWQTLEFDLDPAAAVTGPAADLVADGRAYYKGVQIWHAEGPGPGAKALEKSAARAHSGRIYEGLGLLQAAAHDLPAARNAFEAAGRCYTAPADRIRTILDEAHALADAGQKPAAVQLLEEARRKYGSADFAGSFGELEAELGVTPAPAAAKP